MWFEALIPGMPWAGLGWAGMNIEAPDHSKRNIIVEHLYFWFYLLFPLPFGSLYVCYSISF